MESRNVALPALAEEQLGFFRWGHVAGQILLTTDSGEWVFLSESEFGDLLEGRVVEGHPRFQELQRKGILRDGLDLDAFAAKMARRNRHLRRGPSLHIVTVCDRSLDVEGQGAANQNDMTPQTAEAVVDVALQSTASALVFELQAHGGEPLHNFEVIRHIVEFARLRNKQGAGKTLTFNLLSNLSALDESKAEWLIANDVLVSTSLDGPAILHDENRKWKGGSPHRDVVGWIEYFTRRYSELGRDSQSWCVEGLVTVTRRSLDAWREIVDEYVAKGLRSICLQPLSRFTVEPEAWLRIGYSPQEYLRFYERLLDYVLDLNRRGIEIQERTAALFVTKILTADEIGNLDVQSPSSAGSGQVAYNFDGRIFPGDEARLVDAMGDSIFELGSVHELSLTDVVSHPTVRAIAAASLLDAQPMCADCWNKPYCGFSPVYNFLSQGDLFGQRPHSLECKEHMGVAARLFKLLSNTGDLATAEILKRWTEPRPRFSGGGRVRKPAP